MRAWVGISSALVLLQAEAVAAAEVPTEVEDKKAGQTRLDLTVPDSPALTALGLTTEGVARPLTPRALAMNILNGADPSGNLQTGVAIDSNLFLLAAGNRITLKHYNDHYVTRFLARAGVSAATAKGLSDDDKAVRLAFGLRLTPLDLGDPRRDQELMNCFRDNLRTSPDFMELDLQEVELAEQIAEATDDSKLKFLEGKKAKINAEKTELTNRPATKCREEAEARNWNASSWSLGIAPTWLSPDNDFKGLKWNGASFWTSAAYGFENVPMLENGSQLLAGVQYIQDEHTVNSVAANGFSKQDTLTAAGRLRLRVYPFHGEEAPRIILEAEGDYIHATRKNRSDNDQYRWSISSDFKIPLISDTYFRLSLGDSGGGGADSDGGFISAIIKFGN
jgi:hypothetical protein